MAAFRPEVRRKLWPGLLAERRRMAPWSGQNYGLTMSTPMQSVGVLRCLFPTSFEPYCTGPSRRALSPLQYQVHLSKCDMGYAVYVSIARATFI